jgi:hypothetical protein
MQVSQIDVATTDPDGSVAQTLWRSASEYDGPHVRDLTEAFRLSTPGVPRRTMKTHIEHDENGRLVSAETNIYLGAKNPDEKSDQVSMAFSSYERGRLVGSAEYVRDGESGRIRRSRRQSQIRPGLAGLVGHDDGQRLGRFREARRHPGCRAEGRRGRVGIDHEDSGDAVRPGGQPGL